MSSKKKNLDDELSDVSSEEERKRKNPKEKKITKRLPKAPAEEQKIILNDKSEIKFYNPDFRREIF